MRPAAKAFRVLGLSHRATAEEIKQRHRMLFQTHHPDRNPGNKRAAARLASVNAARDRLLKKDGTLTDEAFELQNLLLAIHPKRLQGPGGNIDVIIAQGMNASMRELLRQVSRGEFNAEQILNRGVRAVRKTVTGKGDQQ